jgi:hypothetical protein
VPEVPLEPVAPIEPVEPLLDVPVPMESVEPLVVPVPIEPVEPLVVPVAPMEPLLLVPMEPLVLEPVVPLVLLEPLCWFWPPIGLPVSAALLVPVLLWSAPRLVRFWLEVSVLVALADELPLLWSFMLALVPAPRVFWVPSLDCAWTVVAPNMAAAMEAPIRPFSSLFIFMSISLIRLRGKLLNNIKKILFRAPSVEMHQ